MRPAHDNQPGDNGMRARLASGTIALGLSLAGGALAAEPAVRGVPPLQAGEYLVTLGGCNDCHTPGWNQAPGKIARDKLLTGNPIGYMGPWGVSYAANLRLYINALTAEGWVQAARNLHSRPPMPDFNVRSMSDSDLKAIYTYIHSLGPAGEAAPASVPPGGKPVTPVEVMVPQPPPG